MLSMGLEVAVSRSEASLHQRLGDYDVIAARWRRKPSGDTERAEFLALFERYRDDIVESG
jgi:hypothetical protein